MEILKPLWRAYNGHVLIVAFMVGLFTMVLISLQQTLAKAEGAVKESLSLVLFLQSSVAEEEASNLGKTLQSQDPEIRSLSYTSKEQAYDEAMKDPQLAKSLMLLKSNPLPASFTLRLSDQAWAGRADPSQPIRGIAAIQEIRWDPQARSLFISLHNWRLWCLRFTAFIGVILLIWASVGLYRFLALQSPAKECAWVVAVGAIGGLLAWGLWGVGLHTIRADISALRPAWMGLVPLFIGAIVALGCFGLEVRHVEE